MKTKRIIKYLSIFFFCIYSRSNMLAQNNLCHDYNCMIELAIDYIQKKDYKKALETILAAQGYPESEKLRGQTDELLQNLFDRIEQQKAIAVLNEQKAKAAEDIAKIKTIDAVKARDAAEAAKNDLQAEKERNQALLDKGLTLQNTFNDTDIYWYLYNTGLKYFKWDRLAQRRDYRNALTYFALARFLEPSESLKYLVLATQTGMQAEDDFHQGRLDSARVKYQIVIKYLEKDLNCVEIVPDFEKERISQIETVNGLFSKFKDTYNISVDSASLQGDWWTIPEAFQVYTQLRTLSINNNHNNFWQVPPILCKPNLEHITFDNCYNITSLKDWACIANIKSLTLSNNPTLQALESMDSLKRLESLSIDECRALMVVEGTKNLLKLTLKSSPQIQIDALLKENKSLKSLSLSNLPQKTINTGNLVDLEEYNLQSMQVKSLEGLEKNTKITSLNLDGLHQLSNLTLPSKLQEISIAKCDNIDSLGNWAPSDNLLKMSFLENTTLKQLPNWSYFPHLKTLLIKDQQQLLSIKGLKQLKEIENLWIINNPNIRTHSINLGLGFEWGVKLNSLKIEYEYRRRGLPTSSRKQVLKGQEFGYKLQFAYLRKDFDNHIEGLPNNSTGFLAGAMATYYSPSYIFAGIGLGVGTLPYIFPNSGTSHSAAKLAWLNNVGIQFAPYPLLKDKMSLTIDLYTFFDSFTSYYILPSFGISYFHTLGMNRKTVFYRSSDARRRLVPSRKDVTHPRRWLDIKTLGSK